jgi:hypothetical protein
LDLVLTAPGVTAIQSVTLDGEYLLFAVVNRRALLLDPVNPDVNNPHSVVWDGNTEGEPSNLGYGYTNEPPQISPDGKSVVGVNWYDDSRGGVWLLSLDRSHAPRQLAQNSYTSSSNHVRYQTAFFSPDSLHVLCRRDTRSRRGATVDQLIVPAAGGAAVKTFSNSPMWVTRWVSADAAP